MTSLDVLYYALAGGFLVFVGFVSFVLYRLGIALITLNQVLGEIEDVMRDIDAAKNFLKVGVLGMIGRILGGGQKGGGGR
ncbi:MAG TPA: hypothetical protein VMW04_03400 [Patescibacteria group bacterium]|nr:hypothetical protein [Patescibacteria group bacterium]